MKQSQFEARHQLHWQLFGERLDALERGKRDPETGGTFASDYRRICHQSVFTYRAITYYGRTFHSVLLTV